MNPVSLSQISLGAQNGKDMSKIAFLFASDYSIRNLRTQSKDNDGYHSRSWLRQRSALSTRKLRDIVDLEGRKEASGFGCRWRRCASSVYLFCEKIEESNRRYKEHVDEHRCRVIFEIGDSVLLSLLGTTYQLENRENLLLLRFDLVRLYRRLVIMPIIWTYWITFAPMMSSILSTSCHTMAIHLTKNWIRGWILSNSRMMMQHRVQPIGTTTNWTMLSIEGDSIFAGKDCSKQIFDLYLIYFEGFLKKFPFGTA